MDYYMLTRYKVWDKIDNIMCIVKKIEDCEFTIERNDFEAFSNGEYERIIHVEDEEAENVVIVQSVPNNKCKDLFVGDVIKYRGQLYEIICDKELELRHIGDSNNTSYHGATLNNTVIYESAKIGNKYENPELLL